MTSLLQRNTGGDIQAMNNNLASLLRTINTSIQAQTTCPVCAVAAAASAAAPPLTTSEGGLDGELQPLGGGGLGV